MIVQRHADLLEEKLDIESRHFLVNLMVDNYLRHD